MTDDLERAIGPDRRSFIKRLVVTTAFAAPAVSSFTMSGVQAVFGGGRIMGIGNTNTTQPPGPNEFTQELLCAAVNNGGGLTLDVDDGPVHLHLVVPQGSLQPSSIFGNTIVCIYKGDLNALADDVPPGETPFSAYAVVWSSPPSNNQPDSLQPITLTVTNVAVVAGNPIYVFDKVSGDVTPAGSAGSGTWQVVFTEDPAFVVTQAQAQAAAPITADPDFTG